MYENRFLVFCSLQHHLGCSGDVWGRVGQQAPIILIEFFNTHKRHDVYGCMCVCMYVYVCVSVSVLVPVLALESL